MATTTETHTVLETLLVPRRNDANDAIASSIAYALWEAEGWPDGQHKRHWAMAQAVGDALASLAFQSYVAFDDSSRDCSGDCKGGSSDEICENNCRMFT